MIDSQTFEHLKAISEKEWGTIYKQLVLFAHFKLTKFGFTIRSEKDSVDAEHFATLAIERLFDGSRSWDFVRFPDIQIHLKGIVKSLISTHFKVSTKAIVRAGDQGFDGSEESENKLSAVFVEGLEDSPEDVVISREKWSDIEVAFGDDGDGFIIFCDWLDGKPPREISKEYGIAISEINNALKRGRRIVKSLFN